ncbi:MAG: CGNR zinc finger domain-containing protein [Vicinamibacteraceae bacterium]|nr:CGNR zinc finger domain-containing protein [Vicinamibacteraceae bacterium]
MALDIRSAKQYNPQAIDASTGDAYTARLAPSLANIDHDQPAIRHERIERFVAEYGPLVTAPGADAVVEPVALYVQHARQVRLVFCAMRDLHLGSRLGAPRRQGWRPILESSNLPPFRSLKELRQQLTAYVAKILTDHISQCRMVALPDLRRHEVQLGPLAPTLLYLAYFRLAQHCAAEPLRLCDDPQCGNVFEPTDQRMKFCSPACSNRVRQRRAYARRKGV